VHTFKDKFPLEMPPLHLIRKHDNQVQTFLVHPQLSTTQIYTETSVRPLGDNYVRTLGGARV
jgi:site-specific recombinase XerC